MLERDDGHMVCYIVKTFPSARKNYESSKRFCKNKGGILPEIIGPKDQSNVKEMLRKIGDKVCVLLRASRFLNVWSRNLKSILYQFIFDSAISNAGDLAWRL